LDPRRLYHFTGFPGIQNIAEINANVVGINVYYGDSTSGQKLGPETLSDVSQESAQFHGRSRNKYEKFNHFHHRVWKSSALWIS
jgi:hypothetical protein